MSRISVAKGSIEPGKYEVQYDFEAQSSNQLSVKANTKVDVQEQKESRGWVWVSMNAGRKAGYVPADYIKKLPDGNWDFYDRWAYGAELTACLYSFLSGTFVLLYGSAEIDGLRNMGLGCVAMIFSSVLMLAVFFRDSFAPLYRSLLLLVMALVLFGGYPVGLWGGAVVLFTAAVEVILYSTRDDERYSKYTPEAWECNCTDIWKGSCLGIFSFLLYGAANFGVFILGLAYGRRKADDWIEEQYDIPKAEWSFAQATGSLVSFNIMLMLLFCLQGFQQVLLLSAESLTSQKQGKCASCKDVVIESLNVTTMLWVHKVIAFVVLVASILHVGGCFAAYEHSGPNKDFESVFSNIPFITGGIALAILGVVLSSAFLDVNSCPLLFKNLHRMAFLLFALLVVHGKNFLNPNFWKYIIGPILLYLIDFAFRTGVFKYNHDAHEFGEDGRVGTQ